MIRLEAFHPELAGDQRRNLGADRALRIADVVLELHFLAALERRTGVNDHLRVQRFRHFVAAFDRTVMGSRPRIGLDEQGVEIEIVEMGAAAADLHQQFGVADHFGQRPRAERSEDFAHFLGDEAEQVHDLFGGAHEFFAQFGLLRADPDRAGIRMALAYHDAAHGDQRGSADPEFLGAEKGGDDDIASGLEAAVGAQYDAVA